MDYIVVEGMKPWDGRYEFDLGASPLTTREWGWIKRLSGYMPLTLEEGFEGGDPELFTVFAVIAMRRAGKIDGRAVPEIYAAFLDEAMEAKIRLESDAETEDDASPPEQSSNGSPVASGLSSSPSSETSPEPPNPSGTRGSAYMEFDRPTSAR